MESAGRKFSDLTVRFDQGASTVGGKSIQDPVGYRYEVFRTLVAYALLRPRCFILRIRFGAIPRRRDASAVGEADKNRKIEDPAQKKLREIKFKQAAAYSHATVGIAGRAWGSKRLFLPDSRTRTSACIAGPDAERVRPGFHAVHVGWGSEPVVHHGDLERRFPDPPVHLQRPQGAPEMRWHLPAARTRLKEPAPLAPGLAGV